MSGLRLMTYDSTKRAGSSLTSAWFAGGKLYKLFRALDIVKPVTSWRETFDWLKSVEPERKIDVWQVWGHGSTAAAYINGEPIGEYILSPLSEYYEDMLALKSRLHPGSLVWFRTCKTFYGPEGKRLALELANFLGCRVASHTFVIGPFQSGLHSIGPGQTPEWPDDEGSDTTGKGKMSMPWYTHTITCLHGYVPKGW